MAGPTADTSVEPCDTQKNVLAVRRGRSSATWQLKLFESLNPSRRVVDIVVGRRDAAVIEGCRCVVTASPVLTTFWGVPPHIFKQHAIDMSRLPYSPHPPMVIVPRSLQHGTTLSFVPTAIRSSPKNTSCGRSGLPACTWATCCPCSASGPDQTECHY